MIYTNTDLEEYRKYRIKECMANSLRESEPYWNLMSDPNQTEKPNKYQVHHIVEPMKKAYHMIEFVGSNYTMIDIAEYIKNRLIELVKNQSRHPYFVENFESQLEIHSVMEVMGLWREIYNKFGIDLEDKYIFEMCFEVLDMLKEWGMIRDYCMTQDTWKIRILRTFALSSKGNGVVLRFDGQEMKDWLSCLQL